jgi:hypothetical protein
LEKYPPAVIIPASNKAIAQIAKLLPVTQKYFARLRPITEFIIGGVAVTKAIRNLYRVVLTHLTRPITNHPAVAHPVPQEKVGTPAPALPIAAD